MRDALKTTQDRSVKLDAFHALHRYEGGVQSKKDPLFGRFMHDMALAMFVLDKRDMNELKDWLQINRGLSEEVVQKLPLAHFIRSRSVRRYIPAPLELASRLSKVVSGWEDAIMADGRPLFRQKSKSNVGMLQIHANMLRHVLTGCLSDPPNMNMYCLSKIGPSGLKIYKCIRGSSQLEVRLRQTLRRYRHAHMHACMRVRRMSWLHSSKDVMFGCLW
jgi:hypothetical protein